MTEKEADKISRFFSPREEAYLILLPYKIKDLGLFYKAQEEAYKKRAVHSIPHSIEILKGELEAWCDFSRPVGHAERQKAPDLDYYDNQRDWSSHYALRYGAFYHD